MAQVQIVQPNPEEFLTKIIEKIAAEQNIKDYEFVLKQLSSEGANFMSVIYRVTIAAPNHPNINLFAKLAILPAAVRSQIPVDKIYEIETAVYTNLAPRYELLQEKYEIPKEDRYKFAKYYGSSDTLYQEAIVLEDLGSQGYSMYDRFKSVNWEYAAKVVEELAKFHALSLSYKNEYPEEYNNNFNKPDYHMLMDMMYEMLKTPFMQMSVNGLQMAPDNVKDRLQKFIDKSWTKEMFLKYYGPSKLGFLIHGDFRASNILFKRQQGKVKHLVPVDYQGVHIGSPSLDLLYFIYCGTDEQFRRLHLKHLLDHYYGTFSRFLRQLKLDPEQVFSRKDFDNDYNDMLGFGLNTAISLLPTILADDKNMPNMAVDGMAAFAIKPNEGFKKRFVPILNEFLKIGVL